jgi:hypothetical protein
VEITVTDGRGLAGRISVAEVRMRHTNDHAPRYLGPTSIEVSEAAQVGSVVIDFAALVSDEDLGTGGEVVGFAATGLPTAFALAGSALVVAEPLDVDFSSSLAAVQFTLLLRDDFSPNPAETAVPLTIAVTNANDLNVTILNGPVQVAVREGAPVPRSLVNISVLNLDNDPLTFTVAGPGSAWLEVRGTELLLIRALDFESAELLTATVRVSDGLFEDSLEVTIIVLNDNEHTPEFAEASVSRAVSELLVVGTVIAALPALDRDAGNFGRVTYAVRSE